MPLFSIELNSFVVHWFSIFSYPLLCMLTIYSLLSCLCQYVTKRGRNRWNLGLLFKRFLIFFFYLKEMKLLLKGGENKSVFFFFFFFNVSNLGGELVCMFVICCYFIFVFYWFVFSFSRIYKLILSTTNDYFSNW